MVKAKELRELANDVNKRKKEEELVLVEAKLKPVMEEMVKAARLGKYEIIFYWHREDNKELPVEIVGSALTEMGYHVEIDSENIGYEVYKVIVTW